MKDLDWTHKRDRLETISPVRSMTWATCPWRHQEHHLGNLALDPFTNKACSIMFAVWSQCRHALNSLLIVASYCQI